MAELKTEPGWKLPRERKPWWVALVIGGVSTGAGIGATLWLSSMQARAEAPPVRAAGMTLPPGSISLDERLRNMESTLKTLSDDMIEVKQRLPPKRP